MTHVKTTRWKPANQLESGKFPPRIRAVLHYEHELEEEKHVTTNDDRIVIVDEEFYEED